MNNTDNLSEILQLFQFQKIFFLVLGIFFVVFLGKFFKRISDRLGETFPSNRLLVLQAMTILSFAFYIFGSLGLVFGILKPSRELLLTLGGSAAVAIGFSLKDLVASIVAGITLLFDRPFQVGDRVTFGDIYGEITSIGLRVVRLQTLDDNEVTIPNAKFMSEAVASGNSGALDMMVVCQFHLDIDADISKAKQLLYQVTATSRFVFLKKPIKIVVEEAFLHMQLVLKVTVKAYVFDVRYEKDFQSDVYERGVALLSRNQIKRPRLSYESEFSTSS